jgi:copper chaperone CopZ
MSTRQSLTITGMSCGHCVARVTKTLEAQPGVEVHNVTVGSADLTLPDPTALAAVIAALDEAGFAARPAQQ